MTAVDYPDFVWVMQKSNSMKDFADGDESFNFGEWQKWHSACLAAGKRLNPDAFKKRKCLESLLDMTNPRQ